MIVTADVLEWRAGQLTATGHVRVEAGADVLEATSAQGTVDRLVVTHGVWHRPDGDVTFATAEIDMRARSGVVTEARLEADGAVLTAGRVTLGEGEVRAEAATLEPCACTDGGRPALSFRAKSIELLSTKVAVIHGGTVRVFDVPLLPVPYWREPLDPGRFRLHIPEIGYGAPGWNAREAASFGVGKANVEVAAAWREDRGARAEAATTGPVAATGALGWDALTGGVRGGLASHAGFADPSRRAAWDLTIQTDTAYATDYAPSWVDRGVAWHDSRLLAAWGPVRATGWLPDDGSTRDYASVRFRPELGGNSWAVAPRVEARAGDPLRLLAGADARASRTWEAIHLEAAADAATDFVDDPAAAANARVEVPFWGEVGGRRIQWFAGVRGEARAGEAGLVSVPTPGLDTAPAAAGPSVRASSAFGSVVVDGDVAALVDTDGTFVPLTTLRASGEAASVQLEGSPTRQYVALQTHGLVAIDTGALHAADTALGWADVTWHPGRLVVGGGFSRGFAADDPLTGTARLGYDDGCSSAILSAAFSPDRDLPDLGLAIVLRK